MAITPAVLTLARSRLPWSWLPQSHRCSCLIHDAKSAACHGIDFLCPALSIRLQAVRVAAPRRRRCCTAWRKGGASTLTFHLSGCPWWRLPTDRRATTIARTLRGGPLKTIPERWVHALRAGRTRRSARARWGWLPFLVRLCLIVKCKGGCFGADCCNGGMSGDRVLFGAEEGPFSSG